MFSLCPSLIYYIHVTYHELWSVTFYHVEHFEKCANVFEGHLISIMSNTNNVAYDIDSSVNSTM
jgi:hypothetical protein